ncbi:TIGR02569 family protein [Pseudonocardia kunmingensis]|uniref:TIGR02569 family protein n=1 Tax=Pseudonocardia kunmingensis TaxID=630975 RepID=UPI001FEAD791|nr:TIGR02569 family protein [Pseudonocardia kunmingensis]
MTAAPVLPSAGATLPAHVRTAFGVNDAEPRPVVWAGRRAWHCGDVLVRPVPDNVVAAWSAAVLDGLEVDGVHIARPLRSSDGRWVVGGWAACRFIPGYVEPRYDEVVEASVRLHAATASVSRPRLLDDRDDLITRSAAGAFGERRLALDPATGGELYAQLAEFRKPIQLVPQLVHPELFGAVLFDEHGVPALIDLVPCWRPAQWAAAVVVVDAVAWGGADEALPHRWTHLEEWPQVLLRALLHRVALHAQHPQASPQTLAGLQRAAGAIGPLL